jgi:hypothetical protein
MARQNKEIDQQMMITMRRVKTLGLQNFKERFWLNLQKKK